MDTSIDPLATDATREPHCFEMKTRNTTYYVGQVDNLEDADPVDRDAGIGTRLGLAWAEAIKCALNPGCVTPQASSMAGSKPTGKRCCRVIIGSSLRSAPWRPDDAVSKRADSFEL